jgi:hypothetical protein
MLTRRIALWVGLTIVLVLPAFAKKHKEEATYPLTATVLSFRAQAEVTGGGSGGGFTNSVTGYSSSSSSYVGTFQRRIYTISAGNKTMEITGWEKGKQRGSRPPLSLGQTLNFRTEGVYLYTVLDDGKEHQYYIMSAEVK